jgi:hypothetical protein
MSQTDFKYLEHKNLKDVTGFKAALQLTIRGNKPVFIGLREDALSVFTDEGELYFYDLEGRPWRLSTLNYNLQRGMSHYGVRLKKRSKESGGGFDREKLSDEELAEFCNVLWECGKDILEAIETIPAERIKVAKPDYSSALSGIKPVIEKITAYTPERIKQERERFASVYQPVPVLPPDHYRAFVLQATRDVRSTRVHFVLCIGIFRSASGAWMNSTRISGRHLRLTVKLCANGERSFSDRQMRYPYLSTVSSSL